MAHTTYVALTLLYAGEQPPGPRRYQIIAVGYPGQGLLDVKRRAEDHISAHLALEEPDACRQFLEHVLLVSKTYAKKHYRQEWNDRRNEFRRWRL